MRVTNSTPKHSVDTANQTTATTGVAKETDNLCVPKDSFQSGPALSSPQSVSTPSRAGLKRQVSATSSPSVRATSTPRSLGSAGLPPQTSNPRREVVQSLRPEKGVSLNHDAEVTGIAQDLQDGYLSADQAVARADSHAKTMRESGASPESVRHFYDQLAHYTQANPGRVNQEGDQSFVSGQIGAETPGFVFEASVSDAFAHRANQAGFEARMSQALGREVNTDNLQDVRDYIEDVARQEGINGVQRELGDYMSHFYTHGNAVEYASWLDSSGNASTVQADARRDGGNRRIMDCDGYASVANEVTRGIQENRYNTRFVHTSGTAGAHAMLTVEDAQTGRGFVVDNNQVNATYSFAPGSSSAAAARQGVLQSLSQFHVGQEITSLGLGLGPDINSAYQSRTPVTPAPTPPSPPAPTP